MGARIMAALEAQERALDLWRELGDERRIGEALRWLALLSAAVARPEDAAAFADEAIAVLQALPPGCELAAAYSTRSRLYLLAHRNDAAVEWGLKAVALARKCEDWETAAETQVNVGSALVPQDAEEGIAVPTEAAANAEERGFPVIASRARMNLSGATRTAGDLHRADAVLRDAIAYAASLDQETMATHGRAHRADFQLRLGRWDEAEAMAREAIAGSDEFTVARTDAVLVLGRVQTRRGDGAGHARGGLAADGFEDRSRPPPAAWPSSTGSRATPRPSTRSTWCTASRFRWAAPGTSASWLFGAGARVTGRRRPSGAPSPTASRSAGTGRVRPQPGPGSTSRTSARWRSWTREEAPLLQGLDLAAELGAEPPAARFRAELRRLGVRSIPRGPRAATRQNPAGLSARQVEVLGLVAEGLTNAEIARRLVLSPKTVDHHVSAILTKLRVESRRDAAAAAEELGIATKDGEVVGPT